MAPSTTETTTTASDLSNVGSLQLTPAAPVDKGPSYPDYFPQYDLDEKHAPIEPFEHTDPGSRADPKKRNLLGAGAKTHDLSPYVGTEVTGVQLSQLTKEGLDELALYTAERKVLVFRDQDFKDIGPAKQIEIASYFGPIHRHPTSGNVKGYPEFHVVYRDSQNDRFKGYFGGHRVGRTSWHTDISYEVQPAGTTFFISLDQPATGGDTLFSSATEAFKRLSPAFQKTLEGLYAVHSGVAQAEFSKKTGGPVRREPIETEHPVVRVHPVTGEKALYVNEGFTRRIVGFKKEESDNLLTFLFDHIAKGSDFQVRATYQPGTVVVWDNRVALHSPTGDTGEGERRHAVRLTPLAEKPISA